MAGMARRDFLCIQIPESNYAVRIELYLIMSAKEHLGHNLKALFFLAPYRHFQTLNWAFAN